MTPAEPIILTIIRGLCSRLDIEYMTINTPFIGIQVRED